MLNWWTRFKMEHEDMKCTLNPLARIRNILLSKWKRMNLLTHPPLKNHRLEGQILNHFCTERKLLHLPQALEQTGFDYHPDCIFKSYRLGPAPPTKQWNNRFTCNYFEKRAPPNSIQLWGNFWSINLRFLFSHLDLSRNPYDKKGGQCSWICLAKTFPKQEPKSCVWQKKSSVFWVGNCSPQSTTVRSAKVLVLS